MARKRASGKKGSEPTTPKPEKQARKTGRRKARERSSEELLAFRQMFALSSKIRAEIFAIFCERTASPKEISAELGKELTKVSYHVKVLEECQLIVFTHSVPRRGAVEHFYKATRPTLIPPDAWNHLPLAVRESRSANIMQHFLDDAGASMEAGVFDKSPGELSWTPLVLDTLGIKEFGQLSRDILESVEDLQAKVSKRLPKGNGKVTNATSATVFLASFISARSPKENKKASATKRR